MARITSASRPGASVSDSGHPAPARGRCVPASAPSTDPSTPWHRGGRRGREAGDEASPAGLVAGARARPRCRRGSTRRRGRGRASAGRPGTSRCRRRPGRCPLSSRRKIRQSRREISSRHLEQRQQLARARGALDPEVVPVEGSTGAAAPRRIRAFTGIQTGPRQFELPPNSPCRTRPAGSDTL